MVVDLDNTGRCPAGLVCAGCAVPAGDTDLTVVTAGTSLGVLCVSLCPACLDREHAPAVSTLAAVHAVAAHCDHLGIGLDEMAAVLGSGWDW